jgi:hypothetical protein
MVDVSSKSKVSTHYLYTHAWAFLLSLAPFALAGESEYECNGVIA